MAANRPTGRGVRRWLAWSLAGLALLAGLWALAGRRGPGPPLDDVDPESRQRLEQVLRDAGGER